MPEGPEIRRATDGIARALAGRRLEHVAFGLPRLAVFEEQLVGREVLSVRPRSKAVLTRFEGGLTLYSHNQLYGRWYVQRTGVYPRTNRQLRVELRNATHTALLYSASDIEVLDDEELAAHPYLTRIGPDALDPAVTEAQLVERLAAREFRGRALGALLLDQGFVAGLGNYLRTEILWWSGLHPKLRPRDLTDAERAALAHWILDVTRQSYRTAGVTACEAWAAERRAEGLPRRAWRHMAFARVGEPCPECGRRIEKIEVASRRLYLCPRCQPAAAG